MLKSKKLLSYLIGAVGLFASCALQAATSFVSADEQKPDHPAVHAVQHLGQLVANRTNNDVSIVVKANGELGNEATVLDRLRKGTLDMGRVSMGSLIDLSLSAKLMSLPYLFRSRDHMWNTLKGDFGQKFESELNANGFVLLMYLDSGTRNFYAKKAIRNKADFSGMRIRVPPSPVYRDLITQLGAVSVSVPTEQVGESLRNGDIDGAESNIVSYFNAEHYKGARYLMLDEHSIVPDVLLMSKKAWNALKPANQEILKLASIESSEYISKIWQDKEREAIGTAKKNGVTIVQKSQIAMTGIESFALKLYSKYVQDPKDLETVLQIVSSK